MKKTTLFIVCIMYLVLFCNGTHAQTIVTTIRTIAGGGTSTAEGIPATNATFSTTAGTWTDPAGNIYVSDEQGYKVRKIDAATGLIYTVAGTGVSGYSGDGGPATNAKISLVRSIRVDGAGNLYLGDYGHGRIRMVSSSTGIIRTVAGGGTSFADGIPATNADLNFLGITVDHTGNIYTYDGIRVRRVDALTGLINTVAGGGTSLADGVPATTASVDEPRYMQVDPAGNLYILDGGGSKVRRVDAGTGIITTIAGGGTSTSDGVPATSFSFIDYHSFAMDPAGNMILLDRSHGYIRRVDAVTGIMSIIAGGGSSIADGIPATAANLDHYHWLHIDPVGNMYLTNWSYGTPYLRKINDIPVGTTTSGDSMYVNISKLCNGPELTVATPHYIAGRSIKTDFGDGFTDSSIITPGYISGGYTKVKHSYAAAGTYTIRQTLYYGTTVEDTISYSYTYAFCRTLPIKFYNDGNANCVKDGTEPFGIIASTTRVDSNGIPVDTVSATSGFSYNAYCPSGTVYKFTVLSTSGNLTTTCPSVGFIADTVLSATTTYPAKYFGMACTTTATFDLAENTIMPITRMNMQRGYIYPRNNSCNPSTGILTLHFSPKYVYTGIVHPAPSTISGNTMTWNLTAMAADGTTPGYIYYQLDHNPATGLLLPGDTVHENIILDPIIGDSDTSNNTEVRIDTVRASSDPNDITVSPAGCLASGVSPTELTYTVRFENTGTDTAFNIYIMDTLSDNLDPQSLRIVMATHTMDVDVRTSSGHGILKFDFPNINLLDSTHHGQCDGAVIYTIKTRPGLPAGAHIYNYAGIYFDYNDAVMTNTADNVIGCPVTLNTSETSAGRPEIYPNPTTDVLYINKVTPGTIYTFTTVVGTAIKTEMLQRTDNSVSLETLPAGIYLLQLTDGKGARSVTKITKL